MTRHFPAGVISFLLLALTATPAFAQGGYVNASLLGDIARFDQFGERSDGSGSGEALGFALRVGTELGSRWGLELEFARPSEIGSDYSPDVIPYLAALPGFTLAALYDVPPTPGPTVVFPYSYRFSTRQRNTTLSTGVWVRQEVSPKFSLVYVGGVAFGRTSREVEVAYEPIRTIFPVPIIRPPSVSESTSYDVGPMVGMEGRVGLTGHVQLVPGVRLHAVEGGWLIRPSVGLAWAF